MAKNKCSPKETIIHTRTAHPDYTYKILKSLEDEGYRVINSSQAVKLTSDKFNSCQYAEENKIPCAETIKIEKKDGILKIKEKIKEWGDVIVKPITSQGQGEFLF